MFDFAIPPCLPTPIARAFPNLEKTLVIELDHEVMIYGVMDQDRVVMVFDEYSVSLITSRISKELIVALADLLVDNFAIENMVCMISKSHLCLAKDLMMILHGYFDCQLVQITDVDEYEWSTLLCQL